MPRFWMALIFGALLQAAAAPLWESGPNYRRIKAAEIPEAKPGFTLLPPPRTGINFSNILALERAYTNSILANGSGVALGDVDGDGWCDIYFASIDGHNALYRNLGGWKFEDITRQAGVV